VKALALVLLLAVTAQARLTATVGGTPVSVPVLWLIVLAVVLALAAAVLWLLRTILREGAFLRLRPRVVNT
jgi:hypothetical protein